VHDRHQIFISSQMNRNTLRDERCSARKVINKFKFVFIPWDWEHDGPAGSKPPIDYCLNEVRRSYALVLIISRTLTKHTLAEYNLAKRDKKHLFIFFKKRRQQGKSLLFRKRLKPSWREFEKASEFESMLLKSLQDLAFKALGDYKATPSTSLAYKKVRS
jgi:hypothetical protein